METAEILLLAAMVTWLIVAMVVIVRVRVFSPAPLQVAPARQGNISLPIAGAIIVAYFMITLVVAGAAIGLHLASPDIFKPEAAATAPVAPSPPTATTADSETAPAAESAPASSPAPKLKGSNDYIVQMVIGAIAELMTVTGVLLVCQALFVRGLRGLGMHASQFPTGIRPGLIGFFCIYPLLQVASIIMSLFYEPNVHEAIEALRSHPGLFQSILVASITIIVAPIAEELFFRGVIQTSIIQPGWGFLTSFTRSNPLSPPRFPSATRRWAAICVASLLFSGVHSFQHFPVIFLLSLGLGYVYERSGNLWTSIVMHAAFNGTQILLTEMGTR